jgi:hypothetical protein
MARKVVVLVEVDPSQETVIQPFGEALAEEVEQESIDTTPGGGSTTNPGGIPDGDLAIDIPF